MKINDHGYPYLVDLLGVLYNLRKLELDLSTSFILSIINLLGDSLMNNKMLKRVGNSIKKMKNL